MKMNIKAQKSVVYESTDIQKNPYALNFVNSKQSKLEFKIPLTNLSRFKSMR